MDTEKINILSIFLLFCLVFACKNKQNVPIAENQKLESARDTTAEKEFKPFLSESETIDTIRKYAKREMPFSKNFFLKNGFFLNIFIDKFDKNKYLAVVLFCNDEPSPPYYAFLFDKNLKKGSFEKKTDIPVDSAPLSFMELKDVNGDGHKDFLTNRDKYQGDTYLYNRKTKKFEENDFYDKDCDEIYFDKKTKLVCKFVGGSDWLELQRYLQSGDTLIFKDAFYYKGHIEPSYEGKKGITYYHLICTQFKEIKGKEITIDSFYGKQENIPTKFVKTLFDNPNLD